MKTKRCSGVIMHISSLPDKHGTGKMGRAAYGFADWLEKAGQSIWQILPLSPTSFGDSPYQSFSVNAGNPYLSTLKLLKRGLLESKEYESLDWGKCGDIDYEKVFKNTFPVLKKAYDRFAKKPDIEYNKFCEENKWLGSYSLFMALKDEHRALHGINGKRSLYSGKPSAIKAAQKRLAKEIDFYSFLQYEFFKQWKN